MDEKARRDSLKHSLLMLGLVAAFVGWGAWQRHRRQQAFREWFHGAAGYSQAAAQHQKSKNPVLIYFHTEWCGYCKKLDQAIFATPRFAQKSEGLIKVSINPDLGPPEEAIHDQWKVRGYPTLFVVGDWSRQACELYADSRMSVDEFMARVTDLAKGQGKCIAPGQE